MKKVKVFSIILSALMAFSLVGCNIAVATPQTESQPAPAAVETPAPAEIAEPTPEPTKEPTPEPTKEPEIEEPTVEETETDAPTEEAPVEEFDPMSGLLGSNMGRYISDETFNDVEFGKDTGASDVRVGKNSITFIYGDWFIQTGNSGDSHPDISYTVVGLIVDGKIDCKFSNLFPRENEVNILGANEGDIIPVPVECIIHLRDVFDSVSTNGIDVAPNALGTNFKPCDSKDETIQY